MPIRSEPSRAGQNLSGSKKNHEESCLSQSVLVFNKRARAWKVTNFLLTTKYQPCKAYPFFCSRKSTCTYLQHDPSSSAFRKRKDASVHYYLCYPFLFFEWFIRIASHRGVVVKFNFTFTFLHSGGCCWSYGIGGSISFNYFFFFFFYFQ